MFQTTNQINGYLKLPEGNATPFWLEASKHLGIVDFWPEKNHQLFTALRTLKSGPTNNVTHTLRKWSPKSPIFATVPIAASLLQIHFDATCASMWAFTAAPFGLVSQRNMSASEMAPALQSRSHLASQQYPSCCFSLPTSQIICAKHILPMIAQGHPSTQCSTTTKWILQSREIKYPLVN